MFLFFFRYDNVKNLNPKDRCYCQKCGELLSRTQKNLHLDHSEMLVENIDDFKLSHPSQVQTLKLFFML